MGYESIHEFTLSIEGESLKEDLLEKILNRFREISPVAKLAMEDDWYMSDLWKWYNLNQEMVKLSEEFPGVLFEVRSDGEGSEDLWVTFFLGGKWYQEEAVVWPKFDKEKLTW